MMKLLFLLLSCAVAAATAGCADSAYPADHCVSETRMTQAREAQATVLKVIPPERITEVIFNDGCNDSEEPNSVVFLNGLSNPLEPLRQESGWEQVPSEYLSLERASQGVTRPFGWGHLVVLWGPTSESDAGSKNTEESSLSIDIQGFSPVATPRPLG